MAVPIIPHERHSVEEFVIGHHFEIAFRDWHRLYSYKMVHCSIDRRQSQMMDGNASIESAAALWPGFRLSLLLQPLERAAQGAATYRFPCV
jgi:hypothetical protein